MIKRSLHIFRGKNCIAFVYLLNSTSMQKKAALSFLALSHLGRFLHEFGQALRVD